MNKPHLSWSETDRSILVEPRRIVKIQCSFRLLAMLVTGNVGTGSGCYIMSDAPDDLKVIGVEPARIGKDFVYLYCESETFDLVQWSGQPPVIQPLSFFSLQEISDNNL